MKRLLVTGASGFLGWNVCTAASAEWDVFGAAFSHSVTVPGARIVRADLTDYEDVLRIIEEIRPDAVIHAAAVSKPNYCQLNPSESRRVNVDAAVNLAGLCAERRIPFVFTSTDMAFDGLNAPYCEDDPVCPVNVYGEQKVEAEEGIWRNNPNASICRMSLMFGQAPAGSGSCLQMVLEPLGQRGSVALFTDECRTMLSAPAAVDGLMIALRHPGTLLHLGGHERASRYEFGKAVAEVFGFDDSGILPCSAKEAPSAVPRAPDLSLDIGRARAFGFSPLSLRAELERLHVRLFG